MYDLRSKSERRIYPRHWVRIAVQWQDRDLAVMDGELCDISARGVFIVSATALPDDVGVGDTTRISIPTPQGTETLAGMVRWRGFHPTHQAIGCGIQLDEESAAVIARLFPALFG